MHVQKCWRTTTTTTVQQTMQSSPLEKDLARKLQGKTVCLTLWSALTERAKKNTEASEVYVDLLGSSDPLYPNLPILKWQTRPGKPARNFGMSTGTADLGSRFQPYHVMVLSRKTEKSLSFEQHLRPQDNRLNEFAKGWRWFQSM